MAFIVTSKTRRSANWKSGKKREIQIEVQENVQRGEDSAKRVRERHVRDALRREGYVE